jgi:alkaline phosphatase D
LQIWLVEGREFRSDNWQTDGPEKTIWGDTQKQWFVSSVESSDATFKILLSPTPVVGPDRATGKNDNHSNDAFRTEGAWLRDFLAKHGVFVINGDRHWQYVSVDSTTGVMEFSQGPSSDSHAQGWQQDDMRSEHKFLRVKGGFIAVNVCRKQEPIIKFTHYDVDGNIVHEETISKNI